MIAHVGGLPFEEWLVPVAATGGGVAIAVRQVFRRMGSRRARRLQISRSGLH